jgi:hypothetical protein
MNETKQRIQKSVERNQRVDIITAMVFLVSIIVTFAIVDAQRPAAMRETTLSPLAVHTMTPTLTADWWQTLHFASPTLEPLPGVPALSLGSSGTNGNGGANQPVSYQTITCPREDVRINGIVTGARRSWWYIHGTAEIPNLWYWKGELSADGQHWTTLYSSQQPVRDGTLVEFLTSTVPKGQYQLRLMAVDKSGNYPEPCVVQIVV